MPALGQDEIAISSRHCRRRPGMLQPGIDFINGVKHEGNILHGDPQALLIGPPHDGLGCLHRREAALVDFGRNKGEQNWYSLGGSGGALHAS